MSLFLEECMFCLNSCCELASSNLVCETCRMMAHANCFPDGVVPTNLLGDVFFDFTCSVCSPDTKELFERKTMSWLEVTALAIYNLMINRNAVSFHWKEDICVFIDDNWNAIFRGRLNKTTDWMDLVSKTLWSYSPHFFQTTSSETGEDWWSLSWPQFNPSLIASLEKEISVVKKKDVDLPQNDTDILKQILSVKPYYDKLDVKEDDRSLQKTDELEDTLGIRRPPIIFTLDPSLHVNITTKTGVEWHNLTMEQRLLGNVACEMVYDPYSRRYIPPYIHRFTDLKPHWLDLMDELKTRANSKKPGWTLPPRLPLDFMIVQPHHIAAINSLCNQFFWTGIDVSEILKYPEFSCVVLYGNLIVGFATCLPDINANESYLTFIFTRPHWRNCKIGSFMLFDIIEINKGRDLTLHVSATNPATLMYNKFCFKVEAYIQNYYEKYIMNDTYSKHAYFYRLSR